MKITIFTPTNGSEFLKELEQSILSQTYTDWEWVILVNNTDLKITPADERIKVFYHTKPTKSIGQLKKITCSHATGDILLEADHDDILTSNCLEMVAEAFKDDNIGFVYSDNAKFDMRNAFVPYSKRYGWTFREIIYNNTKLIAMRTFKPTPFRFSYIWYQPDHVRAWRKSVYDELGGHDESYEVCDDSELMIRTYLNTNIYHIPEVLYIYRITGENTWLKRSKEIQEITKKLHKENYDKLIIKYRKDHGIKQNKKVKVTIITPTYKPDFDKILNMIKSVQAQTFDDYEHIICADSPHPEVEDFIKSLNDDRIIYMHTLEKSKDQGHTVRNTVLEFALGDYVFFLDDDNIIFPNALKDFVESFTKDVKFIVADILHMGPLPRHRGPPPIVMTGEPVRLYDVDTMNCMLDKKALIESGGWETQYKFCGDGYTFERMAKYFRYKKIQKLIGVHL